jgi:iron(III) transport system permease protein
MWLTIHLGLDGRILSWVGNTFLLACGSALIIVVVALVLSYTARLHRHSFVDVWIKCGSVGYAVPGAVIAIGVLVSLGSLDRLTIDLAEALRMDPPVLVLTGSLIGLVFAYVVRFLAIAVGSLESGFQRLCGRFDEAARSLGLTPARTLLRVNLPLSVSALAATAILVFIEVVKELPLTLILRPFNFDTLATKVFELAGDERIAESAPGALIIIAASLFPILLLNKLFSYRQQ